MHARDTTWLPWVAWASCCWLLAAASLRAQPISNPQEDFAPVVALDEIDQATRAHLEQAQQYLTARQWGEAIEALRRITETDSDRLIALPDAADAPLSRYVPIRRYGQTLLARWAGTAPEAVRQYRQSVDGVAERVWREGAANRDASRLQEVADAYFLSSSGDDAAGLLGEILLEGGDTVRARGWWERMHPALRTPPSIANANGTRACRPLWPVVPAPTDTEAWQRLATALDESSSSVAFLSYPDSNISLAELRARLVLVSIVEQSWTRAERELALLAYFHPEETGVLAGRSGRWVDLVAQQLSAARESAATRTASARDWTTFAGEPNRSRLVPGPLDIGGMPLWRLTLPRLDDEGDKISEDRLRVGEDHDGLLSCFPIVVDRMVFVAQPDSVRGVDLYTGKPLFAELNSGDVPQDARLAGAFYESPQPSVAARRLDIPSFGVARYTLSACGHMLFARLGSPVTRWRDRFEAATQVPGFVGGFDLDAQGRLLPAFPLEPESENWAFEGTPVCDGNRLYVAMRRQDEIRIESFVVAYDLASGEPVWRRSLCSAEPAASARWNEVTHNLLTLQHGSLFVNTNLGVVASLDAGTGRLQWLTRYPRIGFASRRSDRSDAHFQRSLTPALVRNDVVIVAPADSDRLFALDAVSGQLLWTTPPGIAADIVHLLGIGDDRLLASGDCLYWFDLHSGELQCQFPPIRRDEPGYARPSPRGYGRGLLAGSNVYWPTRDALYAFAQAPRGTEWGWMPVPTDPPRTWSAYGVQPGNLVPAGRILLIAGATELAALRAW